MALGLDWKKIRDGLVEKLQAVPGVTIVHDFPKIEKDHNLGRQAKKNVDNRRFNAWTVLRSSCAGSYQTCQEIVYTHTAAFIGMLTYNQEESSQDEFDALLDTIIEAFNQDYRLGDVVEIQGPAQLIAEELRQYANTTVHYAEITIRAVQRTRIRK